MHQTSVVCLSQSYLHGHPWSQPELAEDRLRDAEINDLDQRRIKRIVAGNDGMQESN